MGEERLKALIKIPILLGAREREKQRLMAEKDSGSVSDHDRLIVTEERLARVDRRLEMGTDSFIEIRDAYKEATQALIAELVRVENKTEQLVARLEAKNESAFDKIHVQVGELKPKRVSLFQIIASLFGVVIFVGSVIWTLSRYPTGDDFEKISASMNRVELRLAIQQRDIDDLKKAVQKP